MPAHVQVNFAWVDGTDVTFDAGAHAVVDEDIFRAVIAQTEGEFATAELVVENPGEGLLNPSRKQYAWISVTVDAVTTPLFFGRIVGFPRDIVEEQVTFEFVAQFPGWEAARAALFATLKVAPFWDVAFIPDAELTNPDQALEARSALYHYDRVTGAITLSDVLEGDDVIFVDDHLDGSLKFDTLDNPARRVTVTATVEWEQQIQGETASVNSKIQKKFAGNQVNSFTGPGLQRSWPASGDTIGGQSGYEIVSSKIELINPLPSSMPEQSAAYKAKIGDAERAYAQALFDVEEETRDAKAKRWWFNTDLTIAYNYRQRRSETLTFTVENDVQALAFDSDGGEMKIDIRAEDVVSLSLIPARWSTYFLSARGKQSFGYLLARAKAALKATARAVEITIERPFLAALNVSCTQAYTVSDPAIPGGAATGKVKSYRLTIEGATGETSAEITLGVSVGNGAAYEADPPMGDYVSIDALGDDTQTVSGDEVHPDVPDIIYAPYAAQLPTDPGIINRILNDDLVQTITIVNGPDAQEQLLIDNQYPQRDNADAVLRENATSIELHMRSMEPFDDLSHTITVVITQPWAAPQGIDLAA